MVTDASILTKTTCILHSSSMYVIFSNTQNIEVLKKTLDLQGESLIHSAAFLSCITCGIILNNLENSIVARKPSLDFLVEAI